ncbi:MAG: hypothetical protein ACK5NK_11775 [Niabella sp.]
MKKHILYIVVLTLFFTSCVKEEYFTPNANFEVYTVTSNNGTEVFDPIAKTVNSDGSESIEVKRNQQLEFRNTGSGSHFSIWVGVGSKDYFSSATNAQGDDFPLNSPFRYRYTSVGEYRLVVWANSVNANDPGEYSRGSKICTVKVVD